MTDMNHLPLHRSIILSEKAMFTMKETNQNNVQEDKRDSENECRPKKGHRRNRAVMIGETLSVVDLSLTEKPSIEAAVSEGIFRLESEKIRRENTNVTRRRIRFSCGSSCSYQRFSNKQLAPIVEYK